MIYRTNPYNNSKPVEFVLKNNKIFEKEDTEYIPRFTLKNVKELSDIPVNMPIKPTEKIIIKAIKYGMIFNVIYKGEKDKSRFGHERTVYFMVLGRSLKGNKLIRCYHLKGWSVSNNNSTQKIWRMFRLDRLESLTFTGSFFRLPPSGYNMNDKGMRGGIIAKADFSVIRKNQQALIKGEYIQNKEEIELGDENIKFVNVKIKNTDTILDMDNPYENPLINNEKDSPTLRLSFLKSIYGNKYICIMGSTGNAGNMAKLMDTDTRKVLGVYKILSSISGEQLKRVKKVSGNAIFDLYTFDKKI